MINNIEKIYNYISKSPGIYKIIIIRRSKDNQEGIDYKRKVIATYYPHSDSDIRILMPEIIEICNATNSRAYIDVTPIDLEKVVFSTIKSLLTMQQEKNYNSLFKIVNHSAGIRTNHSERKFMFDIDSKDENQLCEIIRILNFTDPRSSNQLLLPTVQGYHLVVPVFDRIKFYENFNKSNIGFEEPEVKDIPTVLLYCNK